MIAVKDKYSGELIEEIASTSPTGQGLLMQHEHLTSTGIRFPCTRGQRFLQKRLQLLGNGQTI